MWRRKSSRNRVITGMVRTSRKTKQLIPTLAPRSIVVLAHENLDEMAALGLIEANVKCVINAASTMNGKYPLDGPLILLEHGIRIFEIAESDFSMFADGQTAILDSNMITLVHNGQRNLITSVEFDIDTWHKRSAEALGNIEQQLSDFIDNTLHYAGKEKEFFIRPLRLPALRTSLKNKHAVVVVRGKGYKNDLLAIKDYIADYKPVLIGVDGGADALLEYGYRPHLIIGDMDSITDKALNMGAEIIVHAYPNGEAPGLKRIEKLGLTAKLVAAPGTSEDIAMQIAFEGDAELIVTLGAHTHMIDFLEKGRKGMASTVLVRMKIGSKLIDAKGVSKLYNRPFKMRRLWYIPAAALFPMFMLGFIHPGFRHFLDVMWIYIKLSIT